MPFSLALASPSPPLATSPWPPPHSFPTPTLTLSRCGYNIKKDVIFLPLSALTATNVLEKATDKLPWYEGPTFIEVSELARKLESTGVSARQSHSFCLLTDTMST